MPEIKTCPNCLKGDMSVFYQVPRVPVHSVLLMPTREVAVNFPKGDIALGHCSHCGFIANTVFDPTVHNYSAQYEETQGFSGTFQAFHHRLAEEMIAKYDLHGKKMIEIGCGKGEFLSLLCEIGNNSGVGFDPAFVSERNPSAGDTKVEFVADFYGEKYAHVQGDFVCCKMTLEHIPDTANFVRTVRRSVGDRYDTVVFFQVPDMSRVLRDLAFWDIYYEHCSYFSAESLSLLFREQGFDVLDVWTDYDDQYLMITAKPSRAPAAFRREAGSNSAEQRYSVLHRASGSPDGFLEEQARGDPEHREKGRGLGFGIEGRSVSHRAQPAHPRLRDRICSRH